MTVKELITELQKMPQDELVALYDDTSGLHHEVTGVMQACVNRFLPVDAQDHLVADVVLFTH